MIFTHFTTQTITAPSYALTQRFLRCLIWICSVETKRKEYKEQQISYPNGFLQQERRLLAHCHLQKVWHSPGWWHRLCLSPVTTGRLARLRGCCRWLIRDSQTKSEPTFGCRQDCGAPLPLQSGRNQHASTADSSAAPGPWTRRAGARREPRRQRRPPASGARAQPPSEATVSPLSPLHWSLISK